MEDNLIEINGMKIFYKTAGAGPPVILIHGLGANWEMWGKAIPYFSREYKVYIPDLPGHGLSDKPDVRYNMDFYADFLAAFIRELKLSEAVLCGVSMGGQAALAMAARHPEPVKKLIIVSISGVSRLFHGFFEIPGLAWLFTWLAGHLDTLNLWFFKKFFAAGHQVTANVVQDYLGRLHKPGAKRAYYRTLKAFKGSNKDLPALAGSIAQPVLIVWGRDDKISPLKNAYILAPQIKNCRLAVINRCGHVPPIEKYREFNNTILNFLRET